MTTSQELPLNIIDAINQCQNNEMSKVSYEEWMHGWENLRGQIHKQLQNAKVQERMKCWPEQRMMALTDILHALGQDIQWGKPYVAKKMIEQEIESLKKLSEALEPTEEKTT